MKAIMDKGQILAITHDDDESYSDFKTEPVITCGLCGGSGLVVDNKTDILLKLHKLIHAIENQKEVL